MDFLTSIHRSVFDPTLYRDVVGKRRRSAVWYVLSLTAVVVGVCTVAHMSGLLKAENPAVVQVSRLFRGLEIRDGELFCADSTSRVVLGRRSIAKLAGVAAPNLGLLRQIPETLLVADAGVDTGNVDSTVGGLYVMAGRGLILHNSGPGPIVFSYPSVLGRRSFDFGPDAIVGLMKRHIVALFFMFTVRDGFWVLVELLFSIVFLTFAACILKGPTGRLPLSVCYVFACYAATPVALGIALQAAAGTSFEIARYGFMLASFVVLVRGIRALVRSQSAPPHQGGR